MPTQPCHSTFVTTLPQAHRVLAPLHGRIHNKVASWPYSVVACDHQRLKLGLTSPQQLQKVSSITLNHTELFIGLRVLQPLSVLTLCCPIIHQFIYTCLPHNPNTWLFTLSYYTLLTILTTSTATRPCQVNTLYSTLSSRFFSRLHKFCITSFLLD